MNDIGYLAPDGTLFECESWEHLDLAERMVEKLTDRPFANRLQAEDYLLDHGFVAVRARDVYARLGYVNDDNKFHHLTEEQRQWLTDHYDEFVTEKQREVDKLLDFYDKE